MPSFIYRAILATSGFRHSATIDKTLLNGTTTLLKVQISSWRKVHKKLLSSQENINF